MLRELHLTGNPDADKLLNDDPFALLVGMLLDQQYPMEHAFSGPLKIANRMDGFDLHKIAATDLETFVELCVTPPAIHRYGGSMARRVHALAQEIIEKYDGETANIWLSGRPKPDGAEVLRRLKALPGFGEQKAKIFLALLGKQRGVAPKGWREAAGGYGDRGSRRSIADVTDAASLAEVRSFKKAAKAAAKETAGS
ncbi:putative HhH-GPD family protein [Kribbella sp. VKM Ac-2571]|uniref:HhH-GPD-type base excision DNA repair protein n=1 Tax=Kribbella sp. VKM Ac-2571 TaxID=2512222 RepID=UPI00105D1232|nr:HhH-GPD-type base excision DNA repair protein [Kribbella sp. VKM Ac-2571]TDO68316.1 putative HhH-GPD family protein [Kribbella sp. VKM Ac-2571]